MLPESFAPSEGRPLGQRLHNGCPSGRVPPLHREALSLYKEKINTRYGLLGPMPSSEAHRVVSGAGPGPTAFASLTCNESSSRGLSAAYLQYLVQ